MNKQVKIIFLFISFCHSSHCGNSYQGFCMPLISQNLTKFENEKEHRSSYEGVCTGHSRARIATHPSSLQGNLKPSNFLLRHNQAFTSFQGTLKPSNFFLPISRGSWWKLLISMLSFSHNLFFCRRRNMNIWKPKTLKVKTAAYFGEKELLPSLSSN